ncbi:flagellar hook FlgE-like domain-containing protein [Rhizobium sp. NXC14]|uniref:flagellar hook-basal body complex protein n=1 Tax=Rhizobium sp. NXC14 TaxID=1981173 RepID=UPI000A20463E|nr:flagellar hook-basal body complex protein [Rhizobium sp. NXC14]ARO31283.1 flagellar hook FlgE-like domain-containing protein [Rhizobium sp. NXC14]
MQSDKSLLSFSLQGELLNISSPLKFTIPGGEEMTLDIAGTTQLAVGFSTVTAHVNGNGASAITGYDISDDGVVSLRYADGTFQPKYRIPLADVASPDNLTMINGNAFSANGASGVTVMGFANSGSFGSVKSGSLEASNVDLASELTEMIESQRSYTANSKVFQTGADLLDVLVNLKR